MLTYCGEQYCHLSVEYHCFPPAGEERDSCLSCFSVALMKYPEESDKKGWVHFGSGEIASVVAGKHLASREGEEGAMVEAGGSCSHPGSPSPLRKQRGSKNKPQDLPPAVTYILHHGSTTYRFCNLPNSITSWGPNLET